MNAEKEKQEIIERINSMVEEMKFQEKGFSFSSVRPKSALELFGKEWKYVVGAHLDAEQIFEASEKDQLKPIDIMLASVYSEGHVLAALKKGKRITLKVSAGDNSYDGTHTIISINGHDVIIPVIKKGDAKGIYQNTEKLEQLELRKQKFESRLQEIQNYIAGKEQEEQTIHEPVMEQAVYHKKEKKFKIGWVEGILAIVAITGIIYLFIPEKKETINTQLA